MVVQVLIPERESHNSLGDHFLNGMLDEVLPSVVGEARGQSLRQPQFQIRLVHGQAAAIAGHASSTEIRDEIASPHLAKVQFCCRIRLNPLCRHRVDLSRRLISAVVL